MWENLQLGPKSHWPASGRQLLAAPAGRAPLGAEGHWRFRGKTLGAALPLPLPLKKNSTLWPRSHSSQSNLSAPSFPLMTLPRLGVKPH